MIITISGKAGSGKSTLGSTLEKELKIPRIYVGKIRREIAKEKGMTLEEFNKYSETNPDGDVQVDKKVIQDAKKLKSVILEGRVMYHFFPDSIKIFLDVNDDIASKRIFNDSNNTRSEAKNLNTVAKVKKSIKLRKLSDDFRYNKYYNIDIDNFNNYDLIVDTSNLTEKQVFDKVMDFINSKKES